MNYTYQIVYWRDIPAQLRIRSGDQRFSRSLDQRFQEAIDSAAMTAGKTSTDDYLEDWRNSEWLSATGDEDPARFADALVTEIESQYPDARLEALRKSAGRGPSPA